MRPIDKGPCPQIAGRDKTVTEYSAWRLDLIDRIGAYCVYCNMPLSHQLQVEHVVPKNPQPGQPPGDLLAWKNMLLACGPCNLAKSNQPSDADAHYLPEFHNGLLAFVAAPGRRPSSLIMSPKPGLSASQLEKAKRTIALFKWDRIDLRGAVVDIRWMKRHEARTHVQVARQLFDMIKTSPAYDADLVGQHIASLSIATGFFVLWFDAFHDEPMVLKYLADPAYSPGVDARCFDNHTYQPIPRNITNETDPF